MTSLSRCVGVPTHMRYSRFRRRAHAIRSPPALWPLAAQLNDHLATRSYLVGGCVTLADLVIYALVHPAVVSTRVTAAAPLIMRGGGI